MMYQAKAKVGILYKTESGKLIWTQQYKDWDTSYDMSELLDDVYQDELEKWQGHESYTNIPKFVVCLGTVNIEDGKYRCKGCDCMFDDFDPLVGEDCCPFCMSKDFLAELQIIKATVYYQDFALNTQAHFDNDNQLVFRPTKATLIKEFNLELEFKDDVVTHIYEVLNTDEELQKELQPACKIAGHTSMSIGDYIVFDDGEVWLCKSSGWKTFIPIFSTEKTY